MNIYIVNLRSTGELWHSMVCKNLQAVEKTLSKGYGITTRLYGNDSSNFLEYYNPNDKSQTATVSRVYLIE